MWSLKTQSEVSQEVADRCRTLRLEQNLTQEEIAQRSGISLRTYRRFEQEGCISLQRFISVIHSLGRIAELESLLAPSPIRNLDEIEKSKPPRQRSRTR